MPIIHSKKYGVYFVDGFDDDPFVVFEADSFEEARDYIYEHYNISPSNTIDTVDIVDLQGNIQFRYGINGSKNV